MQRLPPLPPPLQLPPVTQPALTLTPAPSHYQYSGVSTIAIAIAVTISIVYSPAQRDLGSGYVQQHMHQKSPFVRSWHFLHTEVQQVNNPLRATLQQFADLDGKPASTTTLEGLVRVFGAHAEHSHENSGADLCAGLWLACRWASLLSVAAPFSFCNAGRFLQRASWCRAVRLAPL